jgi:sulfate adenylyltransferase subunit 2
MKPSPKAWRSPAPAKSAATNCRFPRCSAPSRNFNSTAASAAPGATRKKPAPRSVSSASAIRFGQWDPKAQRPEIWNLYNAKVNPGENMRVFPLSNWTEMDVWEYIKKEKLAVPTIYFSHERDCFRRGGQWLPVPTAALWMRPNPTPTPARGPKPNEPINRLVVRVRTIADMISTGMIESPADSVDDIIAEVSAARVTERGTRADDKASEAAMEDRKKAGYF